MYQGIEPFADVRHSQSPAAAFMAALLLPCTDGNPTKSFAWSTNGPWTSRASKLETEAGHARARSSRPFLLQLAFETALLIRRVWGPAQDQSPARHSSRGSAWLEPTSWTLAWCSAPRNHAVQSSRRGPRRERDASAYLPGRTTTRRQ